MMKWDLEANYFVFIGIFSFAIVVGILAGIFPAVVLSRFSPIKVLKGLGTMKIAFQHRPYAKHYWYAIYLTSLILSFGCRSL